MSHPNSVGSFARICSFIQQLINPQLPSLALPLELIERVADFLFEVQPPNDSALVSICSTKPLWKDVKGFMNASTHLRKMGFMRWMGVLKVKQSEDWDTAKRYSSWIRELQCEDGSLISPSYRQILVRFEHLYAVSIDAHSDVTHNSQSQFAYRNLVQALPPSLRRLEITRAHGPDIQIITIVKEYCPNLEELRLGRCTIFNSPAACDFWQSFPFDHDSYMSSQDTDSYAHSLAQELSPLRTLKSLRLGLYLIPSTTVLAHRIYHIRNVPAPAAIEWQQAIPQAPLLGPDADALAEPDAQFEHAAIEQLISLLHDFNSANDFNTSRICTMCFEAVDHISRSAETSANAILKELIPSLEKIQWMNWLSPRHLGLNTYLSTSFG
ncbi:hypothetical protein FRC09_004232 [Ceratobasidium sp. 395]|nr:hypothetical protein FRC09_004232 [Ceratobasidium sp. 395]